MAVTPDKIVQKNVYNDIHDGPITNIKALDFSNYFNRENQLREFGSFAADSFS